MRKINLFALLFMIIYIVYCIYDIIYILYIGAHLLCTVGSVSATQQCESSVCIYVHMYTHINTISLELPSRNSRSSQASELSPLDCVAAFP